MGGCMDKPRVYDQEVASSSERTCLMNVYTVDPRLPIHSQATLSVTGDFTPGPRSDDVTLLGMPVEYPPTDSEGNFLYDPKSATDAFDAVHCAAVVARVVYMYRRTLQRIGQRPVFLRWQWGGAPIGVRPYFGERPEASYSRELAELQFCYTTNPGIKDETIYLCQSFDIVAHMAGHAVLDGLKPTFYGENVSEEVKAMHESFADLTAVFCYISNLETCELIAMRCNGDFGDLTTYIPFIDNEDIRDAFGGREFGMRNVCLGIKITDVVAEHLDWSRAFTSAIYEILVRMAAPDMNPRRSRADALHLSGIHLCGMVLRAYLAAPIFGATYRELTKYILKAELDAKVKVIMKEEFTQRRFFEKHELPKRWHGVNKMGGCTTMTERGARFGLNL